MGEDKANLPFGQERMLQRMVRILSEVVSPQNIAVVSSSGQQLPSLPTEVTVTHDRYPNRGPLEGLASGLTALPAEVEAIYLTGCDTPLLVPKWIEHLFGLLGHRDIVVPCGDNFSHSLSAVYRCNLLPQIEAAIAADQLALHQFIGQQQTTIVPTEQLREVDPNLLSLRNLNTMEDYRAAIRLALLD